MVAQTVDTPATPPYSPPLAAGLPVVCSRLIKNPCHIAGISAAR